MKFLLVRHVHLPTLQTEEVGCSLPGCESTQQLPRKDGKTVRNTNYFSMSKTKSCNFKWHPLTPCRIPHTPSLSLLLNDVEHSTNYVKKHQSTHLANTLLTKVPRNHFPSSSLWASSFFISVCWYASINASTKSSTRWAASTLLASQLPPDKMSSSLGLGEINWTWKID